MAYVNLLELRVKDQLKHHNTGLKVFILKEEVQDQVEDIGINTVVESDYIVNEKRLVLKDIDLTQGFDLVVVC